MINLCAGLVDALTVDGGAHIICVFGLAVVVLVDDDGPGGEGLGVGGEVDLEREMARSKRALRRLS